MHQQDEADSSPDVSSSPDNAAEPVEMQAPGGVLPLDETPADEAADDDARLPVEDVADAIPNDEAQTGEADEPHLLAAHGGASVYELPPDDAPAAEAEPPSDDAPPPDATQEPDDELPEPVEPPLPVKEPRRLPRAAREKVDRQRRYFAACGRCGYFVADCYLMLGEETVQDAILDADDGWVRLEGDLTFRRLLQNAYGIQLDAGYNYFDGACPECRRRFVFIEQTDGPTRLKIHTSQPY